MTGIVGSLAGIAARGMQWWMAELAGLLPFRTATGTSDSDADAIVAVNAMGEFVALNLNNRFGRSIDTSSDGSDAQIADALGTLVKARPTARVRVILPFAACFQRQVEIPAAAQRQARSIMALDLERSTPFKPADVYIVHTFVPSKGRRGWLTASQHIVKRKFADLAVARIQELGLTVDGIDVASADGMSRLGVNVLADQAAGPETAPSHSPFVLFAVLTMTLVASAAWIGLDRRQAALDDLVRDVNAERVKAESVRSRQSAVDAVLGAAQAFRVLKSGQAASVEILNELTRLLPDDVALSDLKMDADAVEFSGLANSSAAVIPILERASMFKDALFTTPVTFDAATGKERFSLRLRLRHSLKTAAAPVPDGGMQ
jgi:general secretion pathway protein L